MEVNTAHARRRGPGERASAEIKNWKMLRKIRSSPGRANTLVKAADPDPRQLTSGWKGLSVLGGIVRPAHRCRRHVLGADDGVHRQKVEVEPNPRESLLDVLHTRPGAVGTKKWCDHGQRGVSTVHLDGRPVVSCLTLLCHRRSRRAAGMAGCPPRAHARAEDGIRCGKDTGLDHFPSRTFAINAAWPAVVMLAVNLLAWTQRLLLDGDLARAEPKDLALPAGAPRRPTHPRTAPPPGPHQQTWPWANELVAA